MDGGRRLSSRSRLRGESIESQRSKCISYQKACKRLKATHVNRPEASAMPGSHILVQALDGISPGEFTILLVHIMGSRTRVVSEPDAKVLDFERFLFVNLNHVRANTMSEMEI